MLLFYIRHAEPIYNPDSLTEMGHLQAKAISKRLQNANIEEIYSSTSTRAIQTATPLAKCLNKEIHLLDFCHEKYAWDELSVINNDGKTWCYRDNKIKQLFLKEENYTNQDWFMSKDFEEFSFKEGMLRIRKNAFEFMASLGFMHDEKNKCYIKTKESKKRICLFAHQGFGLAFLSEILDIPYPMFSLSFDLGHSSMTVIDFDESNQIIKPKVLQLSNDSHLYKEGLSTLYNYHEEF